MKRHLLGAAKLVLVIIGGLLFFWLVLFKLISRLAARSGRSAPCPPSLAWLLDHPIRRRYIRLVLDRIDIRPGERVLELGPGVGTFTVEAARRVGPQGRLISVDIQPEMIAQVKRRVQTTGLANVKTCVASAHDLPLGDASVDRAFLITVLPEIPNRRRALAELHRVLKSDGVLSITEEFPDPDYLFPFETIRLVEASGFSLERRQGNFWVYTVNFRRKETEETSHVSVTT
ncbi:MAG: methyltransferase domain-containing protein [Chloroflexi bacterium]|nr:methyltransferase domain-containing protein [Chloroflexota bacterium]